MNLDLWRCLSCAHEFDGNKIAEDQDSCPNCGSRGIPVRVSEAVEAKITWHELRVLTIWAERWASQHADEDPDMPRVVRTIAAHLGAQHPDKPPLTFIGEIEQLRKHFGEVQQNVVTEKESLEEVSGRAPGRRPRIMTGAELIAAERRRQIEECGWSAGHDHDEHSYGDLAVTAAMLAVDGTDAHVVDPLGRGTPIPLEQDGDAWGVLAKHGHDRVRCLIIAGALIAAEIDRLLRLSGGDEG